MFWIKKILIWTAIAIFIGIVLTIIHPDLYHPVMFIVLISITLIMGFIRTYFSRMFISNLKKEIYNEIINKIGAKINQYGNPEFDYKNRSVFIDYNFNIGYRTSPEFVTCYVKTPEITSTNIVKFNRVYKITKIRNEYYVKFSIHWNNKGNTFQEQLSKNLNELNFYIKNKAY